MANPKIARRFPEECPLRVRVRVRVREDKKRASCCFRSEKAVRTGSATQAPRGQLLRRGDFMIDDCLGIAAQLRKSLSSAATDDAAYQLAKGWLRGAERKGKPEVLCDQLVQRGDDPLEADALCVELKHVTEALSIGPG